MRNAVGAILILVSSIAVAGGSHGGGGGGGGGHAAASGGSGAHASASGGGGAHSGASRADATSASHIQSASQPRSAARTAMRPLPPRPKPRPGPGPGPRPVPTMPPATYLWPTTAAAHPAGWYAIACTEEERRQHKCDDQISALPR